MPDPDRAFRLRKCKLAAIGFCYVEAGPKAGPLVILLHGFPEYRLTWQAQAATLAAAGFRVSARLCTEVQSVHIPDATHWVHHEQPERVGALLRDFRAQG
jgi:pimeloyl-ACP methyl ester carboxylesterase